MRINYDQTYNCISWQHRRGENLAHGTPGARALGWQAAFEFVADNPYLPDFYADMRSWSFHLQIFFLGHRADQYLDLARSPQSAILDRSIYEDAFIFARALHHMNNINERDYLAYRRIFDLVVDHLPPPDLLIYLKAPVSVLMDRIRQRGREIESGVSEDYLGLLEFFLRGLVGDFRCLSSTDHSHRRPGFCACAAPFGYRCRSYTG